MLIFLANNKALSSDIFISQKNEIGHGNIAFEFFLITFNVPQKKMFSRDVLYLNIEQRIFLKTLNYNNKTE